MMAACTADPRFSFAVVDHLEVDTARGVNDQSPIELRSKLWSPTRRPIILTTCRHSSLVKFVYLVNACFTVQHYDWAGEVYFTHWLRIKLHWILYNPISILA